MARDWVDCPVRCGACRRGGDADRRHAVDTGGRGWISRWAGGSLGAWMILSEFRPFATFAGGAIILTAVGIHLMLECRE